MEVSPVYVACCRNGIYDTMENFCAYTWKWLRSNYECHEAWVSLMSEIEVGYGRGMTDYL